MRRGILAALLATVTLTGCSYFKPQNPTTLGDLVNAPNYGYTPIDPLPVDVKRGTTGTAEPTTEQKLRLLPDETIRIASRQISGSANATYGPAKVGYAGSDYEVILDYVKFQTQPKTFVRTTDTKTMQLVRTANQLPATGDAKSIVIVPVYIGVGLRLTASVHVNQGSVDLSNLVALGAAAQAKAISGTLVVQTLGVTGPAISALIPMPSELNQTTIQNAIVALGAIKARLYSNDSEINPRVVGLYNNFEGDRTVVDSVISQILTDTPSVIIP